MDFDSLVYSSSCLIDGKAKVPRSASLPRAADWSCSVAPSKSMEIERQKGNKPAYQSLHLERGMGTRRQNMYPNESREPTITVFETTLPALCFTAFGNGISRQNLLTNPRKKPPENFRLQLRRGVYQKICQKSARKSTTEACAC